MILSRFRSPQRRREKAARSAPAGPLRDYLATPFPEPHTPLTELPLLAIDVETTGLDAATDHVLSVGFVPVDGLAIRLGEARRVVISAGVDVGQSAIFHGLTDDAIAEGVAPQEALEVTLKALAGRVLLAHHAEIETSFLAAACRRVYGVEMVASPVDTLALQHRIVTSGIGAVEEPTPGSLRLWAARERFGLPHYRAHEALVDALACAELYLAQAAELEAMRGAPLTLADVSAR
ncbi:exonuclease domain-containing protein [Janibacter sp. GXQ6167]|uniref:exonuclease domain-containing protein n=1 Tax=Janibacter sp. GXQ6167 TaxID=3240791 RepID=UPI00352377D6